MARLNAAQLFKRIYDDLLWPTDKEPADFMKIREDMGEAIGLLKIEEDAKEEREGELDEEIRILKDETSEKLEALQERVETLEELVYRLAEKANIDALIIRMAISSGNVDYYLQ